MSEDVPNGGCVLIFIWKKNRKTVLEKNLVHFEGNFGFFLYWFCISKAKTKEQSTNIPDL